MSVPGSINQLLIGAAGAGGGGYAIERSLRFNSGDSSYLNRTPSSAGNQKTWTYSFWIKYCGGSGINGATSTWILWGGANTTNFAGAYFSANSLRVFQYNGSGYDYQLDTTQVFRDQSAWYHFVIACDTTQATASNRVKVYVNGQEITTFSTSTYPTQNLDTHINSATQQNLGGGPSLASYLSAYLADVHFIDGQALAPTDFGEYDDSNVWQPIAFAGTYGTNGFKLDFSDTSSNAALGTDSSGNSNTWTVNNIQANSLLAPGAFFYSSTLYTSKANVIANATPIASAGTVPVGNYIYFVPNGTEPTGAQIFSVDGSLASSHKYWYYNGSTWVQTAGGYNNNNFDDFHWGVDTNAYELSASRSFYVISNYGTSVGQNSGTLPVINTQNNPAGVDALRDTPVNGDSANDTGAGGELTGNYATWNPLVQSSSTFSNGNLQVTTSGVSGYPLDTANFYTPAGTGKWYWEFELDALIGSNYTLVGMIPGDSSYQQGNSNIPTEVGGLYVYIGLNGSVAAASGAATAGTATATFAVGDILGWAFDAENGTLQCYKNGVSQGTQFTNIRTDIGWVFCVTDYDNSATATYVINFGQRAFAYTAPSNYKALCTAALSDPTIADGSTAFDTKVWSGNSTYPRSITGLNFSPDLIWLKNRTSAYDHVLMDAIRGTGTTKWLSSNLTSAEGVNYANANVTSLDANGFTIGSTAGTDILNQSGTATVGWAWDGGTSNTTIAAGSLNSSVYNQSAVWSGMCSPAPSSGTYVQGFDGNLTSVFASGISAGSYFTFTPTGGLTFSNSVRVYMGNVSGASYQYNGGTTGSLPINSWTTVATGGGTMTSLGVTRNVLDVHGWFAIEVDGKLLVDSDVTPPNVPSIPSTVRANPSAGFSIVKWTGTGSAATVAHGIAAPKFIITKSLANATNWVTGHDSIGWGNFLFLDTTDAQGASAAVWNNTAPDSNVFSVASSSYINPAGSDVIAYCFSPVEQYSSFGSYLGNGSADGPFVFTGFRPRFVMTKASSASGLWNLHDTERSNSNPASKLLWADSSSQEVDYAGGDFTIDCLSNGFKARASTSSLNSSGVTYIYIAFASHPFKTARAR